MNKFAKLFAIEGFEVVAYKDFEEQDNGKTMFRIVFVIGVDGGAQQVGHGYWSKKKRDEKFAELDEAGARICLNVVREAHGIPY